MLLIEGTFDCNITFYSELLGTITSEMCQFYVVNSSNDQTLENSHFYLRWITVIFLLDTDP